MNPSTFPQRRASDQDTRARVRAFYQRWAAVIQLIVAAVLIVLSFVVVGVAFQVRSLSASADKAAAAAEAQSKAARRTASTSCRRTRAFGPALYTFYKREAVLTVDQLTVYLETIPKRCDDPTKAP